MLTILLFFAVVVITVVLFAGWVVINGTQSVWRLIAGSGRAEQALPGDGPRCHNVGCRTLNPPHAQFCRRCGSGMGQLVVGDAARARSRMSA